MATADTEFANLTKANLAEYLRDIQMPEPVSWWPVAPGWWGVALILLLLIVYFFVRRRRHRSNLEQQLQQIYTAFNHDNNTRHYYDRMTRLLRETALVNTSQENAAKHTAVDLHGDRWVDWLEQKSGVRLTPAARNTLSDDCYKKYPDPPDDRLHREITQCIIGLSKPGNKQGNKQSNKKPAAVVGTGANTSA